MSSSSGIIDIEEKISSEISVIGLLNEGHVFRTYKVKMGTKFVVFKTVDAQDSMRIELLRREYEIGRILSHPSIVSTIEFLEESPVGAAIVMEYIEGRSLDAFLRGNPSSSQRRAVLSDILEGVDYLHRRGVVHNDLKPENIIVTGTGAARIIDFGLSLTDDSAYRGAVGGTEGFSAPELNQGISSPASDVFSLGKLIETIYGGKRYRDVVSRATSRDTAARYQNVWNLRQALRRSRVKRIFVPVTVTLLALAALFFMGLHFHRNCLSKSVSPLTTEQFMDSLYRSAMDRASAQPYLEFARNAMAEYLHHYGRYADTLPEPEMNKAIKIYQSQFPSLKEIVESKPSINTLPAEEQMELMNRLMNGEMF